MTPALARTSFHDPDGSVFLSGEGVLRALAPQAADRIDAFLATATYRQLLADRVVPRTGRADATVSPPNAANLGGQALTWYEHERLPFINYPHEWTPDQLLAACRLTLELTTTRAPVEERKSRRFGSSEPLRETRTNIRSRTSFAGRCTP